MERVTLHMKVHQQILFLLTHPYIKKNFTLENRKFSLSLCVL